MQLPWSGKHSGLGFFFFVCLFSSLRSSAYAFTSASPAKVVCIKKKKRKTNKKHSSEQILWKRDDVTLRQKLSDTGLPLSRTQAHTASHLLAPDNSFAPGAMNGVLLSSQNQLQHTCLLLSRSYCSSMNSRGLEQRETGTHVTALTLWPRYQPPFFC